MKLRMLSEHVIADIGNTSGQLSRQAVHYATMDWLSGGSIGVKRDGRRLMGEPAVMNSNLTLAIWIFVYKSNDVKFHTWGF